MNDQKLVVKGKVNHFSDDPEKDALIKNGTITAVLVIWIFGILLFEWAVLNFFLVSAVAGFLIFFWLLGREKTLIITKTDITYQFLIFKKSRKISSYQEVSIRYLKNPYSNANRIKYEFCECILLQNDGFEFKIVENEWKQNYEVIKTFLEKNYRENSQIRPPRLLFKYDAEMSLFLGMTILISLIMSIGILIENPENTPKEEAYYEGILGRNPEYMHGLFGTFSKDSGDLWLWTKEYPKIKFSLSKEIWRGIKKKDELPQLKIGDTIGLYMDIQDYEVKLSRERNYPYFTSHFLPRRRVDLYGLRYRERDLNDHQIQWMGKYRHERGVAFLPLLFIFGFTVNIFSNRIKII